MWGIHRGPVNSPHRWPVTRKMFSFDDVIMYSAPPTQWAGPECADVEAVVSWVPSMYVHVCYLFSVTNIKSIIYSDSSTSQNDTIHIHTYTQRYRIQVQRIRQIHGPIVQQSGGVIKPRSTIYHHLSVKLFGTYRVNLTCKYHIFEIGNISMVRANV